MNFTTIPDSAQENACLSMEPPQFYWVFALAIGLAAMAGNSLIILVNILKRVARNSTNIIITNLAIVDFLSGASLIVVNVFPQVPKPPGVGVLADLYCRVYCSVYYLWALLNMSVMNLLLVTLDRYMSVVAPFFYKHTFNRGTFLILPILSTWVLGAAATSYVIRSWITAEEFCLLDPNLPQQFFLWGGMWSLFCMLLIPTVFMVLAYAHISIKLSNMPPESQGKRCQKKVTLSCFAAVIIFFGCWFPDRVFFFLYNLNIPSLGLQLFSLGYYVGVSLGFLNSTVNPVLFALFNPNYNNAFKQMLGFGEKEKPSKNTTTQVVKEATT